MKGDRTSKPEDATPPEPAVPRPAPVTEVRPPDRALSEVTRPPPPAPKIIPKAATPREKPQPRPEPTRRQTKKPQPKVQAAQARDGAAEGPERPPRDAGRGRRRGNADADAAGASRSGTAAGAAGYAAQVHRILQGRANAIGFENVNATVGVSFSIGGSGRMTSSSITRPSGDYSVDRAIRSMLSSASFPPPPGGSFSGATTIRVH